MQCLMHDIGWFVCQSVQRLVALRLQPLLVFRFISAPSQMLVQQQDVKRSLQPVAQGQYMVSDTRCPTLLDSVFEWGESRAAAPKVTKSCRTQGDLRLSIFPHVHLQFETLKSERDDKRPERAD